MPFCILAKFHFKLYINLRKKPMRYLSVIRKKSLTERYETDTDFFVERFFTDSLPSI